MSRYPKAEVIYMDEFLDMPGIVHRCRPRMEEGSEMSRLVLIRQLEVSILLIIENTMEIVTSNAKTCKRQVSMKVVLKTLMALLV